MKSSLAIAIFLGALIAAPHPAECKWSRGKASQHAEKAENHYKSGRYDLAVQEFNNAYKLGGDFNMLYYIARSHSKSRNYQKSIIFYTRFLQEGGKKISNTKRRAVEREIQKLRGMASFKFRDKADQATETGDADEDGSLSDAMAKQKAAAYVDQGNRYKARQKFEVARKAYAKAYKLFPDYKTLYPLGMCEVRVGRITEARETYKRFLKDGGAAISPFTRQEIEKELARLEDAIAKKSNEERSLAFIKEARNLYGEGAFAQSLAKLDQAYQIYPNPEYLYEIARTAIQISDYQKAIDSFRKYLAATHGTLPRARQTEVGVELKRLENLLDTERRKKEAQEHYNRGNKDLKAKRYEEAIAAYQAAYKTYQDPIYIYHTGNAQAQYQQYSTAASTLIRYLKEGKGSIPRAKVQEVKRKIKGLKADAQAKQEKQKSLAHVEAGLNYSGRKQHKKALDEFVEAYRLNPDYRILLKIAEATAGIKQYKASIAAYKRYMDSGGRNISSAERARIGKIIDRLGKQHEQYATKQKSLEHYNSAKFQLENGNYQGALDEYKSAYQVYPNYRILYSIAKTKALLKQDRGAIATYKRYLKEGGNDISAVKRKKVQEIIFGLTQSVRKSDMVEKAKAHFEAGMAFKKKKKYSSAIREFDQAYNLVGDYKILYHIGQSESAQDSPMKAIDAYKRYLEEGGNSIPKQRRAEINKELKRLYRAASR